MAYANELPKFLLISDLTTLPLRFYLLSPLYLHLQKNSFANYRSTKYHNTMITVNDISVHFGGTTLFSDVSCAIKENDKIALMGKNGAGKSTLLKIIAGQSKPSTGKSAPVNR